MRIDVFTLCDFADLESEPKMNIDGIFNTIWSPKVPVTYDSFVLAAILRFDHIEEVRKEILLTIVDSDGKSISPYMPTSPLRREMFVPRSSRSKGTLQMAVSIPEITLTHFGEYSVSLVVDGRQEVSIPLYVEQDVDCAEITTT